MYMRSLLMLLLTACGPTTTTTARRERPTSLDPGSRGMRSDAHTDAARDHARRAEELARWPTARTNDTGRFDDPRTGLWYRAWDTTADHARLADVHRSAATRLQAEFDDACRAAELDDVSVSPLQQYGAGGTPVDDGALVFLSPAAGSGDRLVAAMRCHRASMMLGERGMDDCPLDLDGIQLQTYGDASGVTVEIKVRDVRLVPELQRRVARDLEIAAQRKRPAAD